ncbi:YbaB/EbfC family nucleoid-associated protein [Saccharopolyspora griseoalba]|uniref:YbaB/EbfC family nucleoid-associated protein n=1 Tax=Saccharopolyspora griseoalba TaxID=1431848 RepID=A0ABW2LLM0_9PSEU
MPEEFGGDVGATERMVREWQERATEKAERFGRMQQRVEQISVTEASRDGAVRVTVSSNGMLRDLQLAEGANSRPMPKLGAEIMRLVQSAQARIPDLMQQAVADTVGLQDSAAQHVVDQARKTFPELPEGDPERPEGPRADGDRGERPADYRPPRKRGGPEDDWDDDLGNGSFLR